MYVAPSCRFFRLPLVLRRRDVVFLSWGFQGSAFFSC